DRDERHPLLDGPADQLPNLALVKQQLAAAERLVGSVPAMAVRADVHVVDEHLAVLDARETVPQVHAAFRDCLDLGAEQQEAGLERLQQVVVVVCLPVLRNRRLRELAFRFVGHESGSRRLLYYRRWRVASRAASSTAAIMLSGSARPWPAMS